MRIIKQLSLGMIVLGMFSCVNNSTFATQEPTAITHTSTPQSQRATEIITVTVPSSPTVIPSLTPTSTPVPISSENLFDLREIMSIDSKNSSIHVLDKTNGSARLVKVQDDTIYLLELRSGVEISRVELTGKPHDILAVSTEGLRICLGYSEGYIVVLDLITGEKMQYSDEHFQDLERVTWSPHGNGVSFMTGDDNTFWYYDFGSNEFTKIYTCSSRYCWWNWSPKGDTIMIADINGKSLFYSFQATGLVRRWSEDHRYLAGQDTRNYTLAVIWNAADGSRYRSLYGLSGFPMPIAFSFDTKYIASGDGPDYNRIIVWDTATGEIINRFVGHPGGVSSLGFLPGDHLLYSFGGSDKNLLFWDVESGEILHSINFDNACSVMFLEREQSILIRGCESSYLKLIGIEDAQ